ncbi:unnamed protein product [Urochloa humidicola]
MEVGKRDSDAGMAGRQKTMKEIKMESVTEMEVGKRDSDVGMAGRQKTMKEIKMESVTDMEVGKRDSVAGMAVRQKTMKGIQMEFDTKMEVGKRGPDVYTASMKLLHDMDRLTSHLVALEFEQKPVSFKQQILQSKAKRQLVKFEELKWQRRREEEEEEKKKKKKNKKKKNKSREVDYNLQAIELLSKKIKTLLPFAMIEDPVMGNTKEGHDTEVDLALENSKEGHATEMDLALENSEEGHATEMDLALENPKEGHATEVDLELENSKEGHVTKVDLALVNSKECLKGYRSRKEAKEARKAKRIQKELAKYEEWRRMNDEEERLRDPEEMRDRYAYEARLFEKRWNMVYPTGYGRFEDNTSIPCKRYTFNPAPCGGFRRDTLEVFSVKVAELTGGLQFPINVFGMVALRDGLDHNRNVIFKRERDNCQTLTLQNPYLVLTGPVRGVVFGDPVIFEVLLYVRGTTESDDKELSLLAAGRAKFCTRPLDSLLIEESYTSRLSTLEFQLGHIVFSVEATISVKVISGPPDGFYGEFEFVAFTDSLKREVLLHSSGVEELHVAGDEINLSRSVVLVESFGKLMVSVAASDGCVTLTGTKEFKPLEKGTTTRVLNIPEVCLLEITVAWSLFSYEGV